MVCTCWDEFWVKLLFETSCCSLPCYKFEVVPESCSQKTSSSSVVRGFWPPQYGSGNLWAGLIRLHCLLTSFKRVSSWPSSDSCLSWSQDFRPHLFHELIGAVPRLPPIRRRWFVLLYEALPLVSRFWFCQGRLLQTKNLFDSSDLSPSRISLPSFNPRPDIPAHSYYWCLDIWNW